MRPELQRSYAHCRDVARRRARNFYYSFVLLPKQEKDAMCAIYAFMRFCDDLSDEQGASRGSLERWRSELDAALTGNFSGHPVWPAFHDTVTRFRIPHQYFYDMIEGVGSDLEPRRIRTFDDLYAYCYRVASVVGLTTIHVFGFDSSGALPLAEKCGVAFQITNILRDVREDAGNGRVYIPEEDLARFNADVSVYDDRFRAMMAFEAQRARAYYREAAALPAMVHPRSRAALWALIEIYRRLLDRIESENYAVLDGRIALPAWRKAAIVAQAALTTAVTRRSSAYLPLPGRD